MKKAAAALVGILALFTLLAPSTTAERGVGVTLGQIEVTDSVKPGGKYKLPAIGILNTGSEAEEYKLGLAFIRNRTELRPGDNWLVFEPAIVRIEPGKSHMVDVTLRIPASAEPGDYFALLEASLGDERSDATLVGAATKLTFTVAPSSWLNAQRTRINRWLDDASPWPQVLGVGGIGLLVFGLLSKRVRFRLPFEPR